MAIATAASFVFILPNNLLIKSFHELNRISSFVHIITYLCTFFSILIIKVFSKISTLDKSLSTSSTSGTSISSSSNMLYMHQYLAIQGLDHSLHDFHYLTYVLYHQDDPYQHCSSTLLFFYSSI